MVSRREGGDFFFKASPPLPQKSFLEKWNPFPFKKSKAYSLLNTGGRKLRSIKSWPGGRVLLSLSSPPTLFSHMKSKAKKKEKSSAYRVWETVVAID